MMVVVIGLFFHFRICKLTLLLLFLGLKLIELNVCACLRVKSFDLASETNVFGGSSSMINSRFAFKVKAADLSVDRVFR